MSGIHSITRCAGSRLFDSVDCPLVIQPDPACFRVGLQRLSQRFNVYAATSPQPLPAPGLVITPEIRQQSELYLPITEIRRLFYRLYRAACSDTPLFSSTPFYDCLSWVDCYTGFPAWLQVSPDPARLFELLLDNRHLLIRFLCYSFLPPRFNGAGFGRYPGQLSWIKQLVPDMPKKLRLLDAACGSGEETWELAGMLSAAGRCVRETSLAGWTLEPLEVWAAQQQCLPHLPERSKEYRQRVQPLLEQGWAKSVRFQVVDLCAGEPFGEPYDLIRCNGLLGGPIINQPQQMRLVVRHLVSSLKPGGWLLVADHFHGGWKKRIPGQQLEQIFMEHGLQIVPCGEGHAARKPVSCRCA